MAGEPIYVGMARVVQHRALAFLSNQANPLEVVYQLIDNSLDAKATRIYVVFEQDQFSVIDNGWGMVPLMRPHDKTLAEMYLEDLDNGRLRPEDFDIRKEVNPISLRSLVWLAEFAGLSAKIPAEGDATIGEQGLGAMSVRSAGNYTVIYSRPRRDLAEDYWGSEMPKVIPTHAATPPKDSDLAHANRRFVINLSEQLTDHRGRTLEHGTKFVVSQFKEGVAQTLHRTTWIKQQLGTRYASFLRRGVEIIFVDYISSRQRTGIQTESYIESATRYVGIPVINQEYTLPAGRGRFQPQIYYDPKGKRGQAPKLVRKGVVLETLITDLDEFKNREPWSSGNFLGEIPFPDLPETEAPWNAPEKNLPLKSTARTQWAKILWSLVPKMEEAIKQSAERAKERKVQVLQHGLQNALNRALSENEESDLFASPKPPKKPKGSTKTAKKSTVKVVDRLYVVVKDQMGQGVPRVRVVVTPLLPKGPSMTQDTGIRGRIQFGTLAEGRWEIRIVVPRGMTAQSPISQVINISEDHPGEIVPFVLYSPEAKAKTGKDSSPRIRIHLFPMPDIDQAYSLERMAAGILGINLEYPDLKIAFDQNDLETQRVLSAQFAATAICVWDYNRTRDISFLTTKPCELLPKIYKNLKEEVPDQKR